LFCLCFFLFCFVFFFCLFFFWGGGGGGRAPPPPAPVKNGKGPVKGIRKQHLLVYLNIQNHGSKEVHSSWEICDRSYVFFHLFQW